MVFDHADLFGHGFINCLASNLLLCLFHKKLMICETMSLVFAKQIICNFVLSYTVIEEFNLFIQYMLRTNLTKSGS